MEYHLPNDSVVAVHDICAPRLPKFMQRADLLFTDIPYNQALLTNYIRRDGVILDPANTGNFDDFLMRLVQCVKLISPDHCFIETGKEALASVIYLLNGVYRYSTFYNSTYYHKSQNKSYIVHATNDHRRRRYSELEDMDEADAITWLCQHHEYTCIGDLCMGRGLVGLAAYAAGKPFVGTELNPRRLAVLLAKLAKRGATVSSQTQP